MSPPAQRAISGLSWWTADCREPSIAMSTGRMDHIWREVAGPPLSKTRELEDLAVNLPAPLVPYIGTRSTYWRQDGLTTNRGERTPSAKDL